MDEAPTPPIKHALRSRAIQGVLALLATIIIPYIAKVTGLEADFLNGKLAEHGPALLALVLAAWATYGRTDANGRIYFIRKPRPAPAFDDWAAKSKAQSEEIVRLLKEIEEPEPRVRVGVERSAPLPSKRSLTYQPTSRRK